MQGFRCHRHSGNGEIIVVIVVLVLALALIFYPVFTPHPIEKPRQTQCTVNVRQIIITIQMYQQDYGGYFPPEETVWQNAARNSVPLNCPTYSKRLLSYGYNAHLPGKTLKSPGMPEPQVLPVIADSKTPSHLLTSTADIDFRHTQRAIVGYADGHVQLQAPAAVHNLPVKKAR